MVMLHAGAPKTGTTAIQAFLRRHGDDLPGVAHPAPLRGSFARHLLVYARAPRLSERDARLLALDAGGLPEFCRRYQAAVRRGLPRRGTAVSCNELLFRLDDAAAARVAGLFAGRGLTVVLYLRRHDELAISSYLQARKRGLARREVFPLDACGYRSVIETWARVADIRVRLYDRTLMPGGDVVRDFLATIGVEPPAGLPPGPEPNPTWGQAQWQVGGLLDRHFPFLDPALDGYRQRRRRADLMRYLERLPARPVALASRAQARAYSERFADDDEWVRRHYFPERRSLFGDDYARYPIEVPQPPATTAQDWSDALVELWRFHEQEVAALRDTEGARRRGLRRLLSRRRPPGEVRAPATRAAPHAWRDRSR